MKFEFKYSKQTEIDRLIFTYSSIVKNLYQKLGFLLLTNYISQDNVPDVIIPSTQFQLSQKVVKELKKTNVNIGIPTKNNIINEFFYTNYDDIKLITTKELNIIKKDWGELEKTFLKIFETIFSENKLRKVVIIPTQYGTNGSYHLEKDVLYLNIRIDQDTRYIIPLITKALVHNSIIKKNTEHEEILLKTNDWNKKEEMTDYLMKNTSLKNLYPEYKSTTENLENQEVNLDLIKISKRNYTEIGFPLEKTLRLNKHKIEINNQELENLTPTQNKILIQLLKKEEQIITNEEIAEIMWGKNYYDKFSLSAMAKMIHQLREKLKIAGLQKEVIFTKRGKGYLLVQ